MSDLPLERIEGLFHRAVELNPEQRAAFLEIECAGNPELKVAVETLLKHDQPTKLATDFLASPIQRNAALSDTALRPGPADFRNAPGQSSPVIPGYEVLQELGRGGMGVVYKARQTGLNRLVALKMLLSFGPVLREDLARFRTEAKSLAQLHHPNIVQIYEIGEHDGLPYFAMEYIEGPSLAQATGGAAQPPAAAARIVEILARAIAAVHQRGLIHRDLKPANVLLEKSEIQHPKSEKHGRDVTSHAGLRLSEYQPKITDFGLAKQLEAPRAATQTGTVIGTANYMAPEQARGNISGLGPWTDLYALGAILYELLTGRPPIEEATSALTLVKVLNDDALPPSRWRPSLPRDLDTICLKCLEKDPRRRYAGAAELAEDLRRFQAGEPIKARPIKIWEHIWRWCCRQPLAATALASTGILGLALLITVLVYNARLRQSLTKEERLADDRRVQLVQLHISIAVRELDNGDAFTALLWLTEAMKLDEANVDHRRRILEILEHIPWLIKVGLCDGEVLASRFTATDCWLAAAHPDNSVQVWDVNTGKYVGSRFEHPAAVVSADFSPDGRFLATASADGAVRLWRLDDGQCLLVSGGVVSSDSSRKPSEKAHLQSPLMRLAFDESGRFLHAQSADRTVRSWKIANGKAIALPSSLDSPGSILGPDSRFVYSLDSSGKERLWDVSKDQTTTAQVEIEPGGVPAALSRDGSLVAVLDKKNRVHVVETATGKVRGKPLVHARSVQRAVFTPGGDHILTMDADHIVRLWQWKKTGAEDLPLLTVSSGSREEANLFAQFGLDGKFLAALGRDDRLRIWDVTTHQQATPPLHLASLRYEAFSADGQRLLLVAKDHTVRLWDLSHCASSRVPGDHAIQPGLNKDFTLPQLAALVEELAGIRLDEQERPVPLDKGELLATWQRFQTFQMSAEVAP
jgi:serine/threonine protein kinase/WD40 repeat protein